MPELIESAPTLQKPDRAPVTRPRRWQAVRQPGWRHAPWLAAGLHLVLAFILYCRGLDFNIDPERNQWDWFWQTIPQGDLAARPWASLWRLHAQPPGFSLWGLAWLRMVGPSRFPDAMQLGYVLLGAATAAMTVGLARMLGLRRGWALAAGVAVALNPALFCYEAYLLYEPLVLFLLVAAVWCLGRCLLSPASAARYRWLMAFAVALNALALTRSLYHWLFVIASLGFAWPLLCALNPRRRVVLLCLVILPAGLWYAKNAAQYGFFGSSSWQGLGLYKCVIESYDYTELAELRREDVLPAFVADHSPFQHTPKSYVPYGFVRTADLPLLARDDFNNINVPAIARAYGQAAARLIRRDPGHYVRAIYDSYVKFCRPPSGFKQVSSQREQSRIPWEPLVADWLYGEKIAGTLYWFTGVRIGTTFYACFPLLLAGGAWWARRRWRVSGDEAGEEGCDEVCNEVTHHRRAILMAYLVFVCLYVAVVGCLFENGENERFRFATEPLTLVIALAITQSLLVEGRLTGLQRPRAQAVVPVDEDITIDDHPRGIG